MSQDSTLGILQICIIVKHKPQAMMNKLKSTFVFAYLLLDFTDLKAQSLA
jgi:hypothetical protein